MVNKVAEIFKDIILSSGISWIDIVAGIPRKIKKKVGDVVKIYPVYYMGNNCSNTSFTE
jgi:hypothetical protein